MSPAFKLQPARNPIATLQKVSASEAAPALVPAYKFSSSSGENPPKELPSAFAKFVAVMTPLTQASPATLSLELGLVVSLQQQILRKQMVVL